MISIQINCETGEETLRDYTEDEVAFLEAERKTAVDVEIAQTQAATDKAALLAKLGLTADEAKLLLS